MASIDTPATPPVTVTVAPPPGWFDKTMIVHSAPTAPGSPTAANIVVTRDAMGVDEDFAAYCARQDKALRASLPGFAPEGARTGVLHERPAMQMLFTWTSAAGPLRQQATFIDAGARVVVSFTATAAADDFDAHRDVFNTQLAALVIEGGASPKPTKH